MSIIAAALKHMLAAGMPHDAIVAAVEEMEAAAPQIAQRQAASGAERQRRYRERKAAGDVTRDVTCDGGDESDASDVTSVTRDVTRPPSLPPPPSPTPPSTTTNLPPSPPIVPPSPKKADLKAQFEGWYGGYPHKIGKAAALKAFGAALNRATLAELTAGRDRYVREKPADRPWCNPATWLNQDRWLDQPSGLGSKPTAPVQAIVEFAGPPELRAALVKARGEAWAISWLDPCAWDDVLRGLRPANHLAARHLRDDARHILEGHEVHIVEPKTRAAA